MLIWRCDIQSSIKMGGGKSGSSNTTTSTTSPPAWLNSAYQSLVSQAQNVAATPYQNYSGQMVAPLNANQNAAINTTANAQGMTQPYTNAAASGIAAGSQAIYPQLQQFNSQNLQQYMDPNTQNVINTTMAQLNQNDAQQQSQLTGQAIQGGASPFGGDRAGVAAATLAGQQDLANNQTIAGLESQNYTQALNELNNQQQLQANTMSSDAWRDLSGGQEMSQLGTTAQNNTLNQANAQMIAGGNQQQEAQEELNIPYEQWEAQQAYPFQTTDYLGGIETGIGGVAGGTGTTTSPGPSTLSELGGLGLGGLGIYGITGGFNSSSGSGVTGANGVGSSGVAPTSGLPPGSNYKRGGAINGHGRYDIGGVASPSVSALPDDTSINVSSAVPNAGVSFVPQIPMTARANLPQSGSSGSGGSGGSGGNPLGTVLGIAEIASMFNKGGVARSHYDIGGVTLPQIPTVNSWVPSVQMNGHANLPQAPRPQTDSNGSPLQTAMQGMQFGKLLNSGNKQSSNGIAPASSSNFSSSSSSSSDDDSDPLDQYFGTNRKSGGVAGHYDMGGQITTPQQAAMAGANPLQQQQMSQYNSLPIDKLQQLAVSQPQNPMIQKALQMKKMGMSSGSSAPPTTGVAQSGSFGGISPTMAQGGRTHFDDGGSADDDDRAMQVLQDVAAGDAPSGGVGGNTDGGGGVAPSPSPVGNAAIAQGVGAVSDSDLLPPDAKGIAAPAVVTDTPPPAPQSEGELDAKPVVDHSGDTVKVHSEGKTLDTGIPSMKDTGATSSPWAALAAAGFGMMAGKSPHALENIGNGAMKGLDFAMEQRQQAGKENQAQAEADLRQQQMQQQQDYQQSELGLKKQELTSMTPYQQAQVDAKNKELAQAEELKNQSLGLEKAKLQQDQWQLVPDQMGGFLKYNKKTGETQPIAGASGSMVPAIDPKSGQPLTGDAYLATLSPENAAQIKAMDEGRLNFPAGFALKSPYWQQKLSQLYQYNPDASQQTAAAVKAFNQGKQGDQMRSLNVAVNHLDLLDHLTDALNNGDVKALNAVGNAWNSQTGSPAPTNFNTAKQIVGDEVTKAVIGAGGTGADRDKAQSVIDAANSPEQLKGAIQTYKQLMTGQLGGLKQQYEQSTGRKDFDKYLTPAAKTALMPTQASTSPTTITPPAAAIQMLKQNPALAPAFQQKYGVSPQQYLGQ
jgi:hypothetical protein